MADEFDLLNAMYRQSDDSMRHFIRKMTGTQLQSLEQFNAERREAWRRQHEPAPNGIACPQCATELMDTCPTVTIQDRARVDPPEKNVHCPKCGFRGNRLA